MNFEDILYTPLDVPPMPDFDIGEFKLWLNSAHEQNNQYKKYAQSEELSAEKISGVVWPWNMAIAYCNHKQQQLGWINEFDKKFPSLSKYMHEVFQIPIEDLAFVIILPTADDFVGTGFFHQDPGKYGLRLYLDFERADANKLLVKKCITPYKEPPLPVYPKQDSLLQETEYECNIVSTKQAWYINNVKAFHANRTTVPGCSRIAVIVSCSGDTHQELIKRLEPLIVRSAEKYSDYAVIW
jgi:hypothetical protein